MENVRKLNNLEMLFFVLLYIKMCTFILLRIHVWYKNMFSDNNTLFAEKKKFKSKKYLFLFDLKKNSI